MSHELETAGAISLGGFFRRGKIAELLPVGTPCPNCTTPLQGPWCHVCGQLGEDFHRSSWKLLMESAREFLDFDNRIWQTLPDLIVRPGRLTRAYLDGHRAPQVPPLRLFLVVLLALFLIGLNGPVAHIPATPIPTDRAAALKQVANDKRIPAADRKEIVKEVNQADVEFGSQGRNDPAAKWLVAKINFAIAHQSQFWQAVQNWAERFAVLMLPVAALAMSLLYAFQRRFYLFDHIIFSMHSLSFLCLLLSGAFLIERYMPFLSGGWLILPAPVHLFFHMRGVYGSSIVGTLLRMFVLFIISVVGFSMILVGLFWVALNAM